MDADPSLLDVLGVPGLGAHVASFTRHFAGAPGALLRTSRHGRTVAQELLAATERIELSGAFAKDAKLKYGMQLVQRLTTAPAHPTQLRQLAFDLRAAQWPRALLHGGFSSLQRLHIYFNGERDSRDLLPLLPMAVRACSATLASLWLWSYASDPIVDVVTSGALCSAIAQCAALVNLAVSVRLLQDRVDAPTPPAPFLHPRATLQALHLDNGVHCGPDGGVALYALQRAALGGQLKRLSLVNYRFDDHHAAERAALGAAVVGAGTRLTWLSLKDNVELPIGPLPHLQDLLVNAASCIRTGVAVAAQAPALAELQLPRETGDVAHYQLAGVAIHPAAGSRLRQVKLRHAAHLAFLARLHTGPALSLLNLGGGLLTALCRLSPPTISALRAVGKYVHTVLLTVAENHE
jgi:hypothetical protein